MFLVKVSFVFDLQLTKEYLDTISKVSHGWEATMSFSGAWINKTVGMNIYHQNNPYMESVQRDLINWVQDSTRETEETKVMDDW